MTHANSLLNSSSDYRARDAAITCQSYSLVRKLEGISYELFELYWRDVHGPLCARLPGLGFYVQHHFSRERRTNLWPAIPDVRRIDISLDGAVEIGFPNIVDQNRFFDASSILFSEETHLFGWDNAYSLPQGSHTYVDRQADGIPNGPDKLHRLHLYLNGKPGTEFHAWAIAFAEHLASAAAVQKLRLHLPEAYDNGRPQPPSPGVDHYVIDDMLHPAVMEIGFENALAANLFFASDDFQAAVAGQSRHIQAMAVFLVAGVYTYIRDSTPTTAGLRGSRTAEIIGVMGAANQTYSEVTSLFYNKR
ncbi:EthD domain-containing protein [Undibacterium terreum]|uniref:EthD domain-containing protein n=1 Tax=Undibacterium terreum TaxID=1224302 RepID=A0A916UD60_9BURK|nr:EthD domain-containing protein [Undibacterium terreum]GGC66704.1 hypothetical protein GCM10011396_12180 [Undibacterium terreum]